MIHSCIFSPEVLSRIACDLAQVLRLPGSGVADPGRAKPGFNTGLKRKVLNLQGFLMFWSVWEHLLDTTTKRCVTEDGRRKPTGVKGHSPSMRSM